MATKRVTKQEALLSLLGTLASVLITQGQPQWAEYLRYAVELYSAADASSKELKALDAKIQQLVDENRNPTANEILALRDERDAMLSRRGESRRAKKA